MKKIISKIKKCLHNTGSSLVLVIVALAFVGILVGALLTAVAYAYRQKLYDYNARSNFYYLDQAMDEIYAGVGAKTIDSLTEAYDKTREEIIKFDINSESYRTLSDEEANETFKNNFMSCFADGSNADYWKIVHSTDSDQTAYKKSVVYAITTMITNNTVTLDDTKMMIKYVYLKPDGSTAELDSKDTTGTYSVSQLSKIVIKNVRLTRTAKYNRSTANGQFTQTISSDIEISRPDFNVSFGNLNTDISTLFEYCIVADSGVDLDRTGSDILTISGNIYAANDFYNKDYNRYGGAKSGFHDEFEWDLDGTDANKKTYKVNKVSRYSYTDNNNNDLFNNGRVISTGTTAASYAYDGKNDRSKYSGLYIDGGKVNILANTIVVPGSIAVMNGGSLNVYGMNSADVAATDIWADEVVLAGYSLPGLTANSGVGASASFNANMYIKDDTQIESNYSKLSLTGGYYGFSNSERKDNRSFIPTVAKDSARSSVNIYEQALVDANGNLIDKENRGHYNSSSILINGEHASLDLTNTTTLFIGGRSYIELSNTKTGSTTKVVDANKGTGASKNVSVDDKSYLYDSSIDDYKTGESISVKSAQLAYYPSKASGTLAKDSGWNNRTNKKGTFTLAGGAAGSSLNQMFLFQKYFGTDSGTTGIVIPLIIQEVTLNAGTAAEKTKSYYYFDFEEAVKNLTQASDKTIIETNSTFTRMDFPTTWNSEVESNLSAWADRLKQAFIKDYTDYFNFCVNKNSDTKLDWMGYEDGYDDPSKRVARNLGLAMSPTAFASSYPETDTTVLETSRETIDKHVAELQNVTNYQDFVLTTVQSPDKDVAANKLNTSGVITSTEKWVDEVISATNSTYYVATSMHKDNDDEIESNLKGTVEGVENTNSTGAGSLNTAQRAARTSSFVEDYNKHYNYVKYALKDIYTGDSSTGGESEAQFLDKMIDETNGNGEGGITPINYFMNFDKLDNLPNSQTAITPDNLPLGQYKVWASDKDVVIDGGSNPSEITGIIITRGDVYFKNVSKFNGLIICGGKVYVTTSNSTLMSINSTKICRNIIKEVVAKAANYTSSDETVKHEAEYAVRILELFKAYEDIAEKAKNGELATSTDLKDITNIDYSDVLRYNNWMRNVD